MLNILSKFFHLQSKTRRLKSFFQVRSHLLYFCNFNLTFAFNRNLYYICGQSAISSCQWIAQRSNYVDISWPKLVNWRRNYFASSFRFVEIAEKWFVQWELPLQFLKTCTRELVFYFKSLSFKFYTQLQIHPISFIWRRIFIKIREHSSNLSKHRSECKIIKKSFLRSWKFNVQRTDDDDENKIHCQCKRDSGDDSTAESEKFNERLTRCWDVHAKISFVARRSSTYASKLIYDIDYVGNENDQGALFSCHFKVINDARARLWLIYIWQIVRRVICATILF